MADSKKQFLQLIGDPTAHSASPPTGDRLVAATRVYAQTNYLVSVRALVRHDSSHETLGFGGNVELVCLRLLRKGRFNAWLTISKHLIGRDRIEHRRRHQILCRDTQQRPAGEGLV